MVTQEHWEDKIQTDIPFSPSPQFSGVGGVWSPHGEGIAAAFSHQISTGHHNAIDGSTATKDNGNDTSLFPIENYELIYNSWEDDIIFDSEAVSHIPQPTLAQIDPNDPNFIIGIPEEPPQTLPGEKDSRKVSVGLCTMEATGVLTRCTQWRPLVCWLDACSGLGRYACLLLYSI